MSDENIILEILKEIEERIVKVAGGKGYGTGKVYPANSVGVFKMLGKQEPEEKEEE